MTGEDRLYRAFARRDATGADPDQFNAALLGALVDAVDDLTWERAVRDAARVTQPSRPRPAAVPSHLRAR